MPRDIALAKTIVRRFETKLGVPDALHLAVATNSGFTLVTLDQRLADAARMQRTAAAVPR
jgi:predicted nucleic acid-binding protein